jgi:BlaI family penicillinase repressor
VARPRRKSLTELGELQLDVFERLSKLGEGTVYAVLDQFSASRRPRYTTVLTALRALEQKGFVTHREQDRAHVFRPTVEVGLVRGRLIRQLLDSVFGGSPRALVAALLDTQDVSPEVLQQLKELIADKEAKDGRR